MTQCLLQKEIHNSLKIQLSKDNEFNRIIGKIGKQLKLLRHEVVYTFLSLYLLTGPGALLISTLITVSLPIYYFYQNVEKKERYETTRLLMYWPIHAFVHVFDYFVPYIESYVPCYVFLRTVFLIYLSSEWSRGSIRIYRTYIKPLLPHNNNSIISVQGFKS
uniref:Receptor expression-enhancing protein n=1 Tax=Strongyloides venezuelensis TaxID=75913 RepID=A0A0K0FY08_STRVS